MHPFSVLTLGIFVAGYITARWDLVTRLYELAIFAWDHGVVVSAATILRSAQQLTSCQQTRAAKGVVAISVIFFLGIIPIHSLATKEAEQHPRSGNAGISAREQLRRRGSF